MEFSSIPDIPLPVTENTSPVNSVHLDQYATVLAMIIPTNILSPSATRFSNGNNSFRYKHTMAMFTMLLHLSNSMMGAEDPDRRLLDPVTGKARIAIYMEYIVPDTVEVSDPATFEADLRDCIGVRIIVVIHDKTLNFMSAFNKLIKENAGVDEEGKPIKGRAKGRPPAKQGAPDPELQYDFYKKIKSESIWYDMCRSYLDDSITFMDDSTTDNAIYPTTTSQANTVKILSLDCAEVDGIHPAQSGYSDADLTFAFPRLVWRLHDCTFSPIVALAMTLPKTFRWYKQSDAQQRETMRIFKNRETLTSYYTNSYVKQNDMRDLSEAFNQRELRIRESDDPEKVESEIRALKNSMLKNLGAILCPNTHISKPMKIMSKYIVDRGCLTTGPHQINDPELSYFGNMMASLYNSLEQDFGFVTTHDVVVRGLLCALDAYRQEFSLHTNLMLLGGGATGKSFALETIEKILIQGTTDDVGHTTDKADTVDEDMNDAITVHQEAPPVYMGAAAAGTSQGTGSHIIKNKMTACVIKTRSIFVTENGRRVPTDFTSECIGVTLMATNEREDNIPEALSTRTIKMYVNSDERYGFSVNDKNTSTSFTNVGKRNPKHREHAVNRMRANQVVVAIVRKMMYTGCLPKPNCDIGKRMLHGILARLSELHIVSNVATSIRGTTFINAAMENMVLWYAADRFLNDPASPGYNVAAITPEILKDIEPLIFCTEEIALFVITHFRDLLFDMSHFTFVEVFYGSMQREIITDVNTGEPVVIDGYIMTQGRFTDRNILYNTIVGGQRNASIRTKMSPENIKVVFNQLLKTSHNGKTVMVHNDTRGDVWLLKDYLDTHFVFDAEKSTYVCKFDAEAVMIRAFNETYNHRHLRGGRKFILGTAYGPEHPHLLSTVRIEPVERTMLIRNANMDVTPGEFNHISDTVVCDYDLEQFIMDKDAGPGRDVHTTIYDYDRQGVHAFTYPDQIVRNMAIAHGVKAPSKRSIDLSEEEETHRQFKIARHQ